MSSEPNLFASHAASLERPPEEMAALRGRGEGGQKGGTELNSVNSTLTLTYSRGVSTMARAVAEQAAPISTRLKRVMKIFYEACKMNTGEVGFPRVS